LDHNESQTICLCNLSDVRVIADSGPVSFSIFSIERSLTREFTSTWEVAPSLSSRDVTESWVVLMTLGGLSTVFLLSLVLGIYFDSCEKQSISIATDLQGKQKSKKKALRLFTGISPSESIIQSKPIDQSPANQDLQLIEESLPPIFKSDSLWSKFKREVQVYHRWLGIVFHYSPIFPRSMRVLSLFSSIVIMLFVQSVTYNVADPDDGSCEACTNESDCLSLKSTLNMREKRCYWKTSVDEGSGSCHFREIGADMMRMFIVAMISAIVSAPFALSVQYLIVSVLSKEPIDEKEIKKEANSSYLARILSMRQRPIDIGLPESCGESANEDLRNLQKEASKFYCRIVTNENEVNLAKEFRGS
jgi:hypothetical protein